MTALRKTTRAAVARRRTPHIAVARRATARRAPRPATGTTPDWPGRVVLAVLFLGAVAMLSLPQARTASASFGLVPLWLLGLPASAWLALAAARRVPGAR